MNEQWTIYNKTGDFGGISERFGISPITARLLVNRGITDPTEIERFLFPKPEDMYSPHLMKGMDEAVRILSDKIDAGCRLRVIGDYDVDGITSTYILTDALRRAGGQADNYIPHRIRDGYGLNADMIRTASADGIDTVITCDNGISACEAAEVARELGITLIITDHHEIPDILPTAAVIVDPKQAEDTYPCRDICGAVVAAKVAQALFEARGCNTDGDIYLEYMALATICDVVPLKDENRTIAKLGMERLKSTSNLGLRQLMKHNMIDPETINEYHIGFILGPCFNATGRIDDAEIALRMLSATDPDEADRLAQECRDLNEERKIMTSEQEERAFELVDSSFGEDRVIVLPLEGCHESILGIIAGRIKERYNKPAIVVTTSKDVYKGSARSIPAYNMFAELKDCSDLLLKFGGHPMAAGLSLRKEDLEEFTARLNENCTLTESDMMRKLMIDAEVSFNMFGDHELDEIGMLAPFGQNNAFPLFAERDLRVRSLRYMGRENNYLRMRLVNAYGAEFNAVCFLDAATVVAQLRDRFGEDEVDRAFAGRDNALRLTIAYVPKANDFRDVHEIQMNVKAIRV